MINNGKLELQRNVFVCYRYSEESKVYNIDILHNEKGFSYNMYYKNFSGEEKTMHTYSDDIDVTQISFFSIEKMIAFVMLKLQKLYYVKGELFYDINDSVCSLYKLIYVISNSRFDQTDYENLSNYFNIDIRGINSYANQRHYVLQIKKEFMKDGIMSDKLEFNRLLRNNNIII